MVGLRRSFQHYAVVALIAVAAVSGRDLRPSDHGLAYEEEAFPPAQTSQGQDTLTFFGAKSSSLPAIELPEATNITDSLSSAQNGADGNHLRLGLLLASAICGLIGVALLAVSGAVFLLRLRNKKRDSDLATSTSSPAKA